MKRKLGGRMLDYLKKVSSILLIVLLMFTVCNASLQQQEKIKKPEPLFDDHVEKILKEIGTYVQNNEWDFNATQFNKEVTDLARILKDHDVKFDDYYLAVMKFIVINPDETFYYLIQVGCLINGVSNKWVGKWVLIEGSNEIVEEIQKIESDKVSPKQNV